MVYLDPTVDPNNSYISKALDFTLTNNLTHLINGEPEKVQVPDYLGIKVAPGSTQSETNDTSIFNAESAAGSTSSESIFEEKVPPGLAKKGGVPPGLAKKGGEPPGQARKRGTHA